MKTPSSQAAASHPPILHQTLPAVIALAGEAGSPDRCTGPLDGRVDRDPRGTRSPCPLGELKHFFDPRLCGRRYRRRRHPCVRMEG